MTTQLDQINGKAKSDPKLRFTSLAHLLTPAFFKDTWKQMNRRGASGIDGETTKEFEQELGHTSSRTERTLESKGPTRLHRYAEWKSRRDPARRVLDRSGYRQSKTDCCKER